VALNLSRNAIGAAFYDSESRSLNIMEEMPLAELKSDIEQCILQGFAGIKAV
jgi:hypothetical protein